MLVIFRVHPQSFDLQQAVCLGGLRLNFRRRLMPAVAEAEDHAGMGQLAWLCDRGSVGMEATGEISPEGEGVSKGAETPETASIHWLMMARIRSSSSAWSASRVVGTGSPVSSSSRF